MPERGRDEVEKEEEERKDSHSKSGLRLSCGKNMAHVNHGNGV